MTTATYKVSVYNQKTGEGKVLQEVSTTAKTDMEMIKFFDEISALVFATLEMVGEDIENYEISYD